MEGPKEQQKGGLLEKVNNTVSQQSHVNNVIIVNSFRVGNIKLKLPTRVKLSQKDSSVPVGVLGNPANLQVCTNNRYLVKLADNFKAGNISSALKKWQRITSDSYILGVVKYGLTIRTTAPPVLCNKPVQYKFGRTDTEIINNELNLLLRKKVICESHPEPGQVISPIFTRVNKDGTNRLLLNLKSLNETVEHIHFKMESFCSALQLITPHCWLASVDLKSAYYTIPIHPAHQKYFKFTWQGKLYVYVAMPNGYTDGPRVFTKMLKPPFAELRAMGYPSAAYLDDSLLKGDNYEMCRDNVLTTVHLLQSLGFTIHPDKSILVPTQRIEFLGFIIDTVRMTVELPSRKVLQIQADSKSILARKCISVREVSSLLGKYVAAAEAVPYAVLHYRALERDKNRALQNYCGDFDRPMALSEDARENIAWWISNIDGSYRHILPLPIQKIIYSDASKCGWGATCDGISTNGQWLAQEWLTFDINVLELMAAKWALLSFHSAESEGSNGENKGPHIHIRLMLDNTTAISYINRMGGTHSLDCLRVSMDIWTWAEARNIWLSAAHIPGVENTEADHHSRIRDDNKEWSITSLTFNQISLMFGAPDIDLFASRTNCKLAKYVSWKPDPGCFAVDAFSILWSGLYPYCFPPFSQLSRTVNKMQREELEDMILIIPLWPTQSWYPLVLRMIVAPPLVFKADRAHLFLPHRPEEIHPLHPALSLAALKLSANYSRHIDFLSSLTTLSKDPGDNPLGTDMKLFLPNGKHFVSRGTLIPYIQL